MGCLCPKNLERIDASLNEKLNDDEGAPVPNIEDLEANHITIGFSKYQDIPQKRKLAEYLLSNDLNIFKRHLGEVKILDDEEFYELFEGNTEFNYTTSMKKEFKQLAQKFEDNHELTIEWYNNEEYYEWILQIWRPNILQKLKEADDEKEQNALLSKHKIDISKWDDKFREHFQIVIESKPIKTLAERMKNYIKADYGNFDELIKSVNHCKKKVDKGKEESHCNTTLGANLDTTMNRILKEFVPQFVNKIMSQGENIFNETKKKEEEKAINDILEAGLTPEKEKKLIDQVKKIYDKSEKKEENKKCNKDDEKDIFSSLFEYNKEYEELEKLSNKFNSEKTDEDFMVSEEEEKEDLKFVPLNIKEKGEVIFSNKMVKHAILGLSLANVSYSVLHLAKTFMDYKRYSQQFTERLNDIKKKFQRHQNDVTLIDEDIDKAIEQIIKCGQNFQSDLDEVEELMSEIKDAINGVKNERNTSILNIIASSGGILLGIFGASTTKGTDRLEYASATLADFLALVANGVDIATQNKLLQQFSENMEEAKKLQTEIKEEIDKLREKYSQLTTKHFS